MQCRHIKNLEKNIGTHSYVNVPVQLLQEIMEKRGVENYNKGWVCAKTQPCLRYTEKFVVHKKGNIPYI